MDYRARFFSPHLGRFLQPDSLIPDANNPQVWNRYSYVMNRPVNFNDPTGHDPIPWIYALAYVAIQGWNNGRITNSDWETATNLYLPATSPGSKESLSLNVSFEVAGVVSSTYVTTDDGRGELYFEAGGGLATPQITVSATHGKIFGNFNRTSDYEGSATQIIGGINPDVEPIGIAGEVWGANTKNPNYGVDFGLSGGYGIPTSLGILMTSAKPADKVIDRALKKFDIENTKFGNWMKEKVAPKITRHKFEGFGLFACRLAHMCGR